MTHHSQSVLDLYFEAYPRMRPDIGCYIGAGWHPAVLDALQQLQALAARTGVDIRPRQIKEKFGGLRLYIDVAEHSIAGVEVDEGPDTTRLRPGARAGSVREQANAIVRRAEVVTATLCESCGAPAAELSRLAGYVCRRCPACLAALQGGHQP